MNIREANSHTFDLKPFTIPFSSIDDPHSIENREDFFSKTAKSKIFISQETNEGLKISVNAIIEKFQFLIQHEIRYVLTERFSKGPLEHYFGLQLSNGERTDNPVIRDFGYNDDPIHRQEFFRPIAGDVSGIDKPNIEFTNKRIPC